MKEMVSELMVKAAAKHFDVPIQSYVRSPEAVLEEGVPYAEAVRIFLDPAVHTIFVVDSLVSKRLVGLLSRSDVIAIQTSQTQQPATVGSAAQRDVVVLRPTNNVGDALKVLSGQNPLQRPIRQVPIVDVTNQLMGYIDSEDLIRQIMPA